MVKSFILRLVLLFALLVPAAYSLELTPEEEGCLDARGRVVRFAVRPNYIPYEYEDLKDVATGIVPEFIRQVGRRAGFEAEFVLLSPTEGFHALIEGDVDAKPMTFLSGPLQRKYAFSPVILKLAMSVFVPEDSDVKTMEDLQGKVVAIDYPEDLKSLQPIRRSVVVREFASFERMLGATLSGEVDAMFKEPGVISYHLRRAGIRSEMRPVGEPLDVFECAVAMNPGNRVLNGILTRAIQEALDDGMMERIAAEWHGPEYFSVGSVLLRRLKLVIWGLAGLVAVMLALWIWGLHLLSRVKEKSRALENSESRLLAIFENSPDAIFIEDKNGVVLDASPAACAMHGLSRGQLIGKSVFELVPASQHDQVRQEFSKWFSGDLTRYEGATLVADGREVPVEVIGTPLQFEGEQAVLLLVRDVTERKKAEKELLESELRYRSLVEGQNSFITRVDAEGRFTFVNQAFCRFVGRGREELIGKYFFPYIHQEDLHLPKQALDDLVNGKEKAVQIEYRMRARMGVAWIHCEATAVTDPSGKITEVQVVAHDITERRRMYEALEENERRLQFLFEEIPHIAVQGYNEDHKLIFWNRASQSLYGYSREEALGTKIEKLLAPPGLRGQIAAAIDHWVETGEPIPTGEIMKQHADGHVVPVYSARLASRNRSGEQEMYVVDIDLSELKRANEALLEAKEGAERASRAKSEFLANISHELRTPMNGVMGMTGLLQDSPLNDEQSGMVQTILDSTRELLTLIDELLDISRIEAGEVRLQSAPFAPRETVEKVMRLFADRANEKSVDLTVTVHPDTPETMMGDAGRIRQILINLVGNALKFTHDGHIQICMQAEPLTPGWNLLINVQDTGIGMSPELQANVFDKFTQGDSSLTRRHGGVGLGLSITRQLVELMGGNISVKSEPGNGTTFDLNLVLPPLENQENVDVPLEAVPDGPQRFDAAVLLVEDNLVNQKVAVAMIRKFGCTVTVAANGAEALRLLPDHHFDLIFMDCQMPIMDGFSATRAIRQMVGRVHDIPVVAMTAHALKEDQQQCLEAGMNDYLSKPVHREKLLAILQKYCG